MTQGRHKWWTEVLLLVEASAAGDLSSDLSVAGLGPSFVARGENANKLSGVLRIKCTGDIYYRKYIPPVGWGASQPMASR